MSFFSVGVGSGGGVVVRMVIEGLERVDLWDSREARRERMLGERRPFLLDLDWKMSMVWRGLGLAVVLNREGVGLGL